MGSFLGMQSSLFSWTGLGHLFLPALNLAFGTVPLSAPQWAVCVAMASGVLWFGEARKWLLRRRVAA